MNSELPLIIECRCNYMDYWKDNPEISYSLKQIGGSNTSTSVGNSENASKVKIATFNCVNGKVF